MSENNISRRSLIFTAAIVPVAAIRSAAAPATVAPTTSLTPVQLKTLDAFTDRLIPKDENGPGASECGAANYINRVLADTISAEKGAFVEGLAALDAFAVSSQGKPFAELGPEVQDTVLTAMDLGQVKEFPSSRVFFARVRRLTLEGTFSDPFYGGNKGFAGWDLIGYPGPRLAVAPDDQKMHVSIKPIRMSVWGAQVAINLKPVDVAVVGLGAAGGVAVLPMTRAGLKVAGIEAGTWMDPHKAYHADEVFNNVRGGVTSVQKANREIPTVRENASSPTRPRGAIHPMMNAIGGTSIHYWASAWRLKPWDFKTRSEVEKRYGKSAIPVGSTLEDWPLSYDELEPFYDMIEHEVGVSGNAGNIKGVLDPKGNVYEGPRSREYPMPSLRGTEYTEHMMATAKQMGWKPFHGPSAINSQTYNGRPGCVYHGFCGRGGCHISAKNSTAVSTIPAAMKTKNLTIYDLSHVTRIATGPDGKASGVSFIRDGKEHFQPARIVLIASYTYENSRLLLLSQSKAFPKGLANNNGMVGKHFMGHWQGSPVYALFPYNINVWYGTPAQTTVVDDFADDHYDHSGLGFIGGTSISLGTEMHPIEAAAMNTFGRAPQWGSKWKSFVKENAARWTSSYLQTSTYPYEQNFLDLDPEVKDPLGDPVCRITNASMPNEARAAAFGQAKTEDWFRAAGAIEVVRGGAGSGGLTTHAYGGTRMGDNPETNVVNKWGMSHEVPNLGVLGASVMGNSGARNPTLTAQALAWRTAEHLVKNWKTIAPGA